MTHLPRSELETSGAGLFIGVGYFFAILPNSLTIKIGKPSIMPCDAA